MNFDKIFPNIMKLILYLKLVRDGRTVTDVESGPWRSLQLAMREDPLRPTSSSEYRRARVTGPAPVYQAALSAVSLHNKSALAY